MPNRGQQERTQRWEDGAASLQSLGGPYQYLCPLCLHTFGRDQVRHELRLSHAPPKRLGGRLEVLVCDECERGSGHELDAHAHRVDRFRRVIQSDVYPATRARLTFEEITANVQLQHVEGASCNDILVLEQCNHRSVLEQLKAAFQRHVEAGTIPSDLHFRLHLPPTFERRAKVSYLRAAYLAVFATFGYWAVPRPSYDRVRQQIEEPEAEHIAEFFYRYEDLRGYNVGVIWEPSWQSSIVVLVGDYQITLPLEDDDGIYERLAERAATGGGWTARGRWFGWPLRPQYLWDRRMVELRGPGQLVSGSSASL
jgi:hypothetical protein